MQIKSLIRKPFHCKELIFNQFQVVYLAQEFKLSLIGASSHVVVDAGLGEIGRNGLLIAPWFGPRVQISKIIKSLLLVPDKTIELVVRHFCGKSRRCVKDRQGSAI